jgi:hypothetical protein
MIERNGAFEDKPTPTVSSEGWLDDERFRAVAGEIIFILHPI